MIIYDAEGRFKNTAPIGQADICVSPRNMILMIKVSWVDSIPNTTKSLI